MTDALKQAFDAASSLPTPDQDALARWIMDELASEKKWSDLFGRSEGALASLAKEALAEHAKGECRDLTED
ncbi:MAG: hypothetical protein R3E01_15735 [Pirellulaceae bacterium]|nr:hypothetical protein [Planctomycetales bacterium]